MDQINDGDRVHCMDCSWEGLGQECQTYAGAKACPTCGSDARLYDEWLTDKA